MSSTRLPKKSLMDVCGKPLIWHVVERAKHSKSANIAVLATTSDASDDQIYDYAVKNSIVVFRGDLNDVLDRYYQAAKKFNADIVVRITGDSPLVDPALIDVAVDTLNSGAYDYVSNSKEPWMDGFDVEAFTFNALEDAWKNAVMASEREHVTPYIRNKMINRIHYLENDPWFDGVHLSVDNVDDLGLVRKIYSAILDSGKDHVFSYLDVKELLTANPDLLKINKNSIVNEGYVKSLKEDKKIK